MNKEEWRRLYEILNQIHSDFYTAYHEYDKGKNKKIRKAGERRVEDAIFHADHHICKNIEAYKLLTGDDGSDYSRAIIYDEFRQPRYFGRDLGGFLKLIQTKINSLE